LKQADVYEEVAGIAAKVAEGSGAKDAEKLAKSAREQP